MSTPINRAGMNAATQASVAAATAAASGQPPQQAQDMPTLNSYIYEHLIRLGHFDTARALLKESNDVQTNGPTKTSPNQRNANGITDHLDDSKDNIPKRPDDLPESKAFGMNCEKSFLADWWFQFWDLWSAQRQRSNASGQSMQYLQHNVAQNKLRQQTQAQMLQQMDGRGMNLQFGPRMGNMPNGMNMQNNLQKAAIANNRNMTPAQIAQMRGANQQQMMQNEMKRDGSNMEIGGQRPQSPSGENAPSPKRQRLENANGFPGQNAPGNRPGMPGQQPGGNNAGPNGQMLLQNGIGPNEINAQQMMGNPNLQMAKEAYAQNLAASQGMQAFNMPKGMNPNGPQGVPMNQQGAEGMDFAYNGRGMPANAGGQSGNHALQDYQMQLMLLEQQNKKRLLMARQEQDNAMSHGPGGSGPSGPTGFPQGMSPNARPGPSPSPADQMKRNTPQLKNAGLPGAGSPMPNSDQNKGSPMPGQGFEPSQMPPGAMNPHLQQQVMMRNGGMMMQPGQHPMGMNMANFNQNQQMEMIRQQNGGRMPNGMAFPQGGPGMPQAQGQQGGPMSTPQQRTNTMPPPPAPGGAEAQRTNPSSPQQQNAAPPTPSQTNKANPKKKDAKPKATKKSAANTGATPAADPEPATPTPQTPITPMHPSSFGPGKNGAVPQNANAHPGQPAAAQPAAQPVMDPTQPPGFGGLEGDGTFDVGFPMTDPDGPLLDNFDFDSFLQTDGADGGFDFNAFGDIELEAAE